MEPQLNDEFADRCQKCGAKEKDLQKSTMFGGYFKITCLVCGTVVSSGRKSPVVEF